MSCLMQLKEIGILNLLSFSLQYYKLIGWCLKLMDRQSHNLYRPRSAARTVKLEDSDYVMTWIIQGSVLENDKRSLPPKLSKPVLQSIQSHIQSVPGFLKPAEG